MSGEETPKQRKVKVDLSELTLALEQGPGEVSFFLDLETGAVLRVTDEISRESERILEEVHEEEGEDLTEEEERAAFAEAVERSDLPDWEKEAVEEAARVEWGFGTRYIRVPGAESDEGYRDMEDFIDTVGDARARNRLAQAIQGRGAFRRFKDELGRYPRERERWFEFKDARLRQRALEWLEDEGIEPV